jgi:hypothetical protein
VAVARCWNKTPWKDWPRWPDKPPVTYTKIHEEEFAPPPSEVTPNDFIEVLLVDDAGSPMADTAYELKMPDGQVASGKTDRKGKCWVPQMPSGSCEFALTGIDEGIWKSA